ncbi:hypothetical protein TanjilG_25706 [Lupinus angustifolius]|uniref:SHSP domain-containing protein n=1 Tax=Lupinus angustifolius TaxID=3871 RepID=A0A1J7H4I1_LUPAN|nr:PREDICTED: 18.1 kDa class I heat shock protein-like [Lupinus angustifolius]OIW01410.1 hypothetical protein TanjilG_25706 [Lupinus angustifolius]
MDWAGHYRGGQRDPLSSPSTVLWDPYGDNNWDNGLNRCSGGDETSALVHANVDWQETDTAHVFRADLPGVNKEDLKVQVEEGNILQISGEKVKEQEQEDQNRKWHRVERRRGCFKRRFRLPENVNMDEIGCTLKDGVLTVSVPKLETKPENKNVRQIDVA